MHRYLFTLLVLLVCIGFSCTKGMPEDKFLAFIMKEENGLKLTKAASDFRYELQYCPTDYLLLIDKHKQEVNNKNIEAKRNLYDKGLYFFFKIISPEGISNCLMTKELDKPEADKRFDYFNYKFKDEIKLVQQSDTTDCNLFFFENSNNLNPECKFILGFKPPKLKTSFDILFKGIQLNGISLKYTFDYKNILNSPKANINI